MKTLTDCAVFDGDDEIMSDSEAADWAVQRLGETHEDPFMLMVGFLRPHVRGTRRNGNLISMIRKRSTFRLTARMTSMTCRPSR